MGWFRGKRDDRAVDTSADDLAVVEAVLRHYPAGSQLHFGSPTRCPDCGDFGMVRHVAYDLGVCSNDCLTCRCEWTITLTALRTQRRQARAAIAPSMPATPAVAWPRAGERADRRVPAPVDESEIEPVDPTPSPVLGATLYVDLR